MCYKMKADSIEDEEWFYGFYIRFISFYLLFPMSFHISLFLFFLFLIFIALIFFTSSPNELQYKRNLFGEEVAKYQRIISMKIKVKKILMRFSLFVIYSFLLSLVVIARHEILWAVFGSVTVLSIFVYFVIYKTQKYSSYMR